MIGTITRKDHFCMEFAKSLLASTHAIQADLTLEQWQKKVAETACDYADALITEIERRNRK